MTVSTSIYFNIEESKMHKSLIWQIAQNLSLIQALNRQNIPYQIKGNSIILKTNPFRDEKTCSIRGYMNSNLLYDFGTGDTFNSFDVLTINSDIKHAIKTGLGLQNSNDIPAIKNLSSFKRLYDHISFNKEFNSFEKINLHNSAHLKEMMQILPLHKWINPDLNNFLNQYCRFDPRNKTLVVGIFNENTLVGYKWRRLNIDGVFKKWIARRNSIASTPMLNIIPNSTSIFVCEGIHDFLSSTLSMKSVLSIPSANYNQTLPDYILKKLAGRHIYLVPDNDRVGSQLMERMQQQLSQVSSKITKLILPSDVHDFSELLALEQDTDGNSIIKSKNFHDSVAKEISNYNITDDFDMDF